LRDDSLVHLNGCVMHRREFSKRIADR
jgi:hypothetical protein